MDNLNDLKAIWLTAKTDALPEPAQMTRIVKRYRSQKLLKIIALIVTALVLVGVMVIIMFEYRSVMATTRVGEVMIIAAGLVFVATNMNSLNRFYKLTARSNREFIQFLEHTRTRQLFYYKWTQVVALFFCSAGLLFYMYEGVYHAGFFIISYIAVTLYILIMWLYVRPRVFKKQSDKLNTIIVKMEKLSKQL